MTRVVPGVIRRVRPVGWVSAAGTVVMFVLGIAAHHLTIGLLRIDLFRKDLGIPESSKIEGIDKFAAFMASLSTPLLVALAAVAPLALIFGAGMLMFGHRRAVAVIAGTVGALALAACASGLIN
jgi:hypothetical protein